MRPAAAAEVTSHVGPYVWYLDVDLSEADGVTTLAFSQPDVDHDDSLSVGPGWEYYLDRLVAVETGGDLAAIDFERDYYPAMADYYREQRDACYGVSSSMRGVRPARAGARSRAWRCTAPTPAGRAGAARRGAGRRRP